MMFDMGTGMGLSSRAIAYGGTDNPWDPADLLRCIRYCERSGLTTTQLQARMSGRSASWDRLLPEWDALTALLDHEMSTRTDGSAPRTYRAMKRVLAAGVECETCHGSGERADCLKCKGTGRRSGGRCRAPQCHRGALPCPICDGRGYRKPEGADQ